jgi:hypothetical protein
MAFPWSAQKPKPAPQVASRSAGRDAAGSTYWAPSTPAAQVVGPGYYLSPKVRNDPHNPTAAIVARGERRANWRAVHGFAMGALVSWGGIAAIPVRGWAGELVRTTAGAGLGLVSTLLPKSTGAFGWGLTIGALARAGYESYRAWAPVYRAAAKVDAVLETAALGLTDVQGFAPFMTPESIARTNAAWGKFVGRFVTTILP